MLEPELTRQASGARELISRLAAAVMIADERVTESELTAVEQLRELGLGPLAPSVAAELERAIHAPIDVARTTAALADLAPGAGVVIVSALALIAASDQELSRPEIQVLSAVAEGLGLSGAEMAHIVRSAAAGYGARIGTAAARPIQFQGAPPGPPRRAPEPPPATMSEARGPRSELAVALSILGLDANASTVQIDAAYVTLVRRYDPAGVLELGSEFAVLAVQKLETVTAAYVAAREAMAAR